MSIMRNSFHNGKKHHKVHAHRKNKWASYQGLVHAQFYWVCSWGLPVLHLEMLLNSFRDTEPPRSKPSKTNASEDRLFIHNTYILKLRKVEQPSFLPTRIPSFHFLCLMKIFSNENGDAVSFKIQLPEET